MSAEVAPEPVRLYRSPLGLFEFQAEGVAYTYWQWTESDEPVRLALWDAGVGKSHLAMASAAMLFEDGLVDHVVVVAEANKVADWVQDDFPTFTDLNVAAYAGTIAKRRKMLAALPQVLVMTYETGRNDICEFKAKSTAITGEKMLTAALRGKRVAIVFDEFSRLRNRTAKVYLAWNYLINRVLRRVGPAPMVLGLTATSVERDPEDHWNAGRILAPDRAGDVAWFYDTYVAAWDLYERPARWKNLTPADCEPGVTPLNQLFGPITLRKRKTDPDVLAQFPAKVENPPIAVDLTPDHQTLYDMVEEVFADETLEDHVARQGFGLLRQIAGHPMSLLRSRGQYAGDIVASVGAAYLERLGSAKIEAVLDWQRRMADQQTVIFTFYGQSVLPLIEHALRSHGYRVSINHGGLALPERKRQQDAYKAGDTQIFLSSDAGAKGLNLGVGSGLLHYEDPLLYSTFVQRSERIHRIDSVHPSVTIDHLVVRNTLEEAISHLMLNRAEWAEKVQDGDLSDDGDPTENHLRASERRILLRRALR